MRSAVFWDIKQQVVAIFLPLLTTTSCNFRTDTTMIISQIARCMLCVPATLQLDVKRRERFHPHQIVQHSRRV